MNGARPAPSLLQRDRERAWRWAEMLGGRNLCVWRLEALKAALARGEAAPGTMPDPDARQSAAALLARLCHTLAFVCGALLFLVWALRWTLGARLPDRLPPGTVRLAAAHGEWSTRTRHLLAALPAARPPVDAVLLLGRFRRSPASIARLWHAQAGQALPPVIVPLSIGALAASLADWPRLLAAGWNAAANRPAMPSFREWTGIAFRVVQGAAAARWWRASGCHAREALFAITGTADTTLLERAMQAGGTRTVHAVHGQTTGPNLIGLSDLALFRSGYDALLYAGTGSYGACTFQPAAAAAPAMRGQSGLLLLTNLAHPMNAGYRARGPADEIALIRAAGEAARILGVCAQPLLWKPHPVLASLPVTHAQAVRAAARDAGFAEVAASAGLDQLAGTVRWLASSPSTVALDLLQAGWLTLLLDPQGTAPGTALAALPGAVAEPDEIAKALAALDDGQAAAGTRLAACLAAIRPAGPLDLSADLCAAAGAG